MFDKKKKRNVHFGKGWCYFPDVRGAKHRPVTPVADEGMQRGECTFYKMCFFVKKNVNFSVIFTFIQSTHKKAVYKVT